MADCPQRLQPLFQALGQLEALVEGDDHDASAQAMTAYAAQLQHALALQPPAADEAPFLQQLLERQQQITARMAALRDDAGAKLRHSHQSARAARAYHRTEMP